MSEDGLAFPPAPPGGAKEFGAIAIERGYCTPAQIDQARAQLKGASNPDLPTFLQRQGILTQQQVWACERALRGATVVAGFEILEKVGQGGMGAVFRARQISMDRIVALKILPSRLAQDPAQKARFLNEAHVSARLSHLNIISGIDCGEANGVTFFAMEYVDGPTLKQVLKQRGKLPPAEALSIVRQIAAALVYAHKQGLVHRDVKPDNIMLTSKGVAKLCDLGLAKRVEKKLEESAGRDLAMGTPHYIAPEQARGEKYIDTRADLYALGATFYHFLTGRTPFSGPSSAIVMSQHLTHAAPNPCDLETDVPLGYGQVVVKMMAKAAENRYATPEELCVDLNALAAGRVPQAAAFQAQSSCAWPAAQAATVEEPSAPEAASTAVAEPVGPSVWLWAVPAVTMLAAVGVFAYVWYAPDNADVSVTPGPPVEPPLRVFRPDTGTRPPVFEQPPAPPPPAVKMVDQGSKISKEPVAAHPALKPGPTAVVPPVKPPLPLPPPPTVAPHPEPPAVVAPVKLPVDVPVAAPEEPPQVALTPEILYARFLGESAARIAKADLRKVIPELRERARGAEYQPAAADLQAELADLAAAEAYEQEALARLGAAGGEIDLNEETARKFKAARAQVTGFDSQRGLQVKISGAESFFTAVHLRPETIVGAAGDQAELSKVRYLAACGSVVEAAAHLDKLPDAEKPRWQRKLELMRRGEQELTAEAHLALLAKLGAAKRWTELNDWATRFVQTFGATACATAGKAQLLDLLSAAQGGLADGLGADGQWQPDFNDGPRAGSVRRATDPKSGKQVLVLEGQCDHAPEGNMVSFTRSSTRNLTLAGKKEFTLRARQNLFKPLALAIVLVAGDKPPCKVRVSLKPVLGFRTYTASFPEDLNPEARITKLSLEAGGDEHFVLEIENLSLQ